MKNISGLILKNIGPGKHPVVKRIKSKDARFSMGNYFWLSDGLYSIEEISNPSRCGKRRVMILRPLQVDSLDDLKKYIVYKLIGRGI